MIVKRKLTEEEIKHNERVLQSITYEDFFTSNNLFELYDNKGMIMSINDKYCWSIGVKEVPTEFAKWDKKAKSVLDRIGYHTSKKLNLWFYSSENINKKDRERYDRLYNKMYNSYILNVIQQEAN